MASMMLRAAVRKNGLAFGAGRRVFQIQRRPQSSPAKGPSDGTKAQESKPLSGKTSAVAVAPLPIWQRLGPLTRVVQAYGRSQRARPYTTQFWSAIVIYLIADLSAQSIGGNEYDPLRTGRSLIIGAAVAIPNYQWFIFLSNNFNFASRWVSLAAKIVFSQIVYTPTFNSFFFSAQALLSGEGFDGAVERVKNTVPQTVVMSAKFWPPFTAFSFTFIPMEYRAIFAGSVAVVWQTYLSFVNRQAELMEAQNAHPEEAKVEVVKVQAIKVMEAKPDAAKLVGATAQAAA